ncbi:DNA mismatch endonuclease Vsr [Erythrobacter sp. NFXS35]|uniref:very short patch repair endonuclease n=1 Tax=Erythrobacter sp. NFXS35 TaxID=2818436 RepID=UPI0032DE4B8F
MTDIVSREIRSRMMSGIRSRDTRPEVRLRRELHALGHRFRLHARDLAGTPDIVMPRRKAAIQVHGCFWHRHVGCKYTSTPATRPDFWQAKFDSNRSRDARNLAQLQCAGWRTAIVWECCLRGADISEVVRRLDTWLRSD